MKKTYVHARVHTMDGRGECEVLDRMSRPGGLTDYSRSARWIVWSTGIQGVLSEHPTRRAAVEALEQLAD